MTVGESLYSYVAVTHAKPVIFAAPPIAGVSTDTVTVSTPAGRDSAASASRYISSSGASPQAGSDGHGATRPAVAGS